MTRQRIWILVRAVLLTWVFLGAAFWRPESKPPMPASQAAVYFVIASAVVPVMLLLVVGIQAVNPRSDPTWTFPAWDENFLDFGQPLRFFHFGGALMGATAVGASLSIALGRTSDYWPIGGAGGLAMGLWLGVRLCWRLFSQKRRATHAEQSRRRRTSGCS